MSTPVRSSIFVYLVWLEVLAFITFHILCTGGSQGSKPEVLNFFMLQSNGYEINHAHKC